MLTRLIEACLRQRFLVFMATAVVVGWGMYVAPFPWSEGIDSDLPFLSALSELERDQVPVDAIPDLGENQQIVYAEWPGRSPQDVEDQVTYPLTTDLQGIPGVETIRSSSMEGFAQIYVVFDESAEYYWTRARLNEQLASISDDVLPDGVQPQMGPDATALGQIYWYTLEGRDEEGNTVGGWDDDELRAIQDFTVTQALASAEGVSEVGSIGGKVREYQVELDPDAMRAYDVTLEEVSRAVQESNEEVGAGTTEISGAEYMIRGIGFVEDIADFEGAVIRSSEGTPITVGDVARIQRGPDGRRGALTKGGVEAVGGVVTARYGSNPREVIENVQDQIELIEDSLPRRELDDGTVSQVEIVPFYDRTDLIDRTVGTLETALGQQIMITVLVILLLMLHLRTSLIVSGILPLAVLGTFVVMKYTGIEANVLALAGIAIAIGTIVDMAIVMTENIAQHLEDDIGGQGGDRIERVARGAAEVAPAVVTAIATTVISFLPVFLLTGQEGRLFTPLAFTKTYALLISLFVAVLVIPVVSAAVMGNFAKTKWLKVVIGAGIATAGAATSIVFGGWMGVALALAAVCWLVDETVIDNEIDNEGQRRIRWSLRIVGLGSVIAATAWLLTHSWMPLGADQGGLLNFIFVIALVGGLLGIFWAFRLGYRRILKWILDHKALFLPIPAVLVVAGVTIWFGFGQVFGWLPDSIHESDAGQWMHHEVQGLDREFMPHLDEGDFLYMPTTMPHASMGQALEMTKQADLLIESVPEVEMSVGKLGRAETPLDPAPISMLETVITYEPEFKLDEQGQRKRFAFDDGEFLRDDDGELVADDSGRPYRNWRDHIEVPRDIWNEIVEATDAVPGLTSASLLQPISTRIVMLQAGIRAPMAVRLQGDDLQDLADAGSQVEAELLDHPMVNESAVNADRPVGKPYIHVEPDRSQLARYGITMAEFQATVDTAIGGRQVTETVEGRERFGVEIRYPREMRDSPERIEEIFVTAGDGTQIPMGEVADVEYVRGPEAVRSENAALVSYVMFDAAEGAGPIDTVEAVDDALARQLEDGDIEFAEGVRYDFAGEYEQNLRAQRTLMFAVPLMLLIIFSLIYLQFRSIWTSLAIFSAVAVAFSGGFIMLWLFGQQWFLDIGIMGTNLRDVFQVEAINLSVAVWVGFIALFGIAADDGIVISTYLKQRFEREPPSSIEEARQCVIDAGMRRIRPCLMTTATTILAMLPILTSYGAGADVMIPMAVPIVGGMALALLTLFVVPVLYGLVEETKLRLDR